MPCYLIDVHGLRERVIDTKRLGVAFSKHYPCVHISRFTDLFYKNSLLSDLQWPSVEGMKATDNAARTNDTTQIAGVYELKSAGSCVDAERVCHSYLQYEQFDEITCKATRRKSAPGSLATLSRTSVRHPG